MAMALLRSPLNPLFFQPPWIPRPLRLAASSSFASPLPSHPAIARASAFRTHLFLVSPAAAPIPQCSRMTLAPPPPPTSRSSMASRIFKDLQVDSSANYSSETQHTALKNHLNRFPSPVSLVSGASRGIGFEFTSQLLAQHPDSPVVATCRNPSTADNLMALKEKYPSQLTVMKLDVTDERTAKDVADEILNKYGRLDLYINTVGILHNPDGMQPERKIDQLTQDNAISAYKTNAIGPTIVAKHMLPLLKLGKGEGSGRGGAVLAHLSAKVGSIDDNKIGGWYSYRASKAGLNQLTRTIGMECLQLKEPIIVVLLHPGTVDTDLSKPFSRNVDPGKLFTPSASVEKLLRVIDSLKPEDSAKFFNYEKFELPW